MWREQIREGIKRLKTEHGGFGHRCRLVERR